MNINGKEQFFRTKKQTNKQTVFSCDFEKDNCLWNGTTGSTIQWERYRGDVLPYQQRPPYDHTTRSEHVSEID